MLFFLVQLKTYWFHGFIFLIDQLPDGFKNHLELLIVFAFYFIQFLSKVFIIID